MDQLASLCGEPKRALLIDFLTTDVRAVPFRSRCLGGCPDC